MRSPLALTILACACWVFWSKSTIERLCYVAMLQKPVPKYPSTTPPLNLAGRRRAWVPFVGSFRVSSTVFTTTNSFAQEFLCQKVLQYVSNHSYIVAQSLLKMDPYLPPTWQYQSLTSSIMPPMLSIHKNASRFASWNLFWRSWPCQQPYGPSWLVRSEFEAGASFSPRRALRGIEKERPERLKSLNMLNM